MLKLVASDDQRDYARTFLSEGSVANRGSFDGDQLKQLFGMIGQVLICDLLAHERPKNLKGFDGGSDLLWNGLRWDVKCLIGTTPWKARTHAQNLHARQIGYACDGYIFLHYDSAKGEYTLCGYILKHDFLNNALFFKEGAARPRSDGSSMIVKNGGMYEIKGSKLKQFKKEELHGKHRFI